MTLRPVNGKPQLQSTDAPRVAEAMKSTFAEMGADTRADTRAYTRAEAAKVDAKLAGVLAAQPQLTLAEAGRLLASRALQKHIKKQQEKRKVRQAKRRLKGKAAKPKPKLLCGGAVSPR